MGREPRILCGAFLRLVNIGMQRFKIATLVDITETRQYRKEPSIELEWNQQQNFAMLIQSIGMRVNPLFNAPPLREIVDISSYNFGTNFKGHQAVWTFNMHIEYDGGFTDSEGNPVGLLLNDLHLVPIVSNLTNTASFKIDVFDTKGKETKNTVVYANNT